MGATVATEGVGAPWVDPVDALADGVAGGVAEDAADEAREGPALVADVLAVEADGPRAGVVHPDAPMASTSPATTTSPRCGIRPTVRPPAVGIM